VGSARAGTGGRPSRKELSARLERIRARAEATTAGRLQRRVTELDLIHQAMVLAALTMTLLIPALITLAALIPLGEPHGAAVLVARRLGLSAQATRDLQSLFGGTSVERSSTTWVGATVTLLSAYAWPTALQKGYELAWQLPSRGLRGVWRPLVWLVAVLAAAAAVVVVGGLVQGGSPLPALLLVPVVFAWTWWTQHLLLGGRVGWRPLIVGAVAMTVGLYALRVGAQLTLSAAISLNFHRYGPIGIVFVLLSWFVGFGVVMLGGAVVGAELWGVRHPGGGESDDRESGNVEPEPVDPEVEPGDRGAGTSVSGTSVSGDRAPGPEPGPPRARAAPLPPSS
jgi:membrane protein